MTTEVGAKRNLRNSLWIYLLAASFLTYYAVMIYAELFQPGRTGIDFEFSNGSLNITAVDLRSPAGRAGLVVGDKLLRVDQRFIRTWEDWRHFLVIRQTHREYRFGIERAGQELDVPVVLGRQADDPLMRLERKRFVQAFLLLLSIILVCYQPGECVTRVGALLLAAIGTAPLFPSTEMIAVWRGLPSLAGLLLWIPQISHLLLLPIFFTFFALFPKAIFQKTWGWSVVWAPALMVAGIWAPHIYAHVYRPPVAEEVPGWMRLVLGAAVLIYCGGGLIALLLNYRSLPDAQDRLRLRVFVLGAIIGLTPVILFLTAIFWGTLTQSPLVWFFVSEGYRHLLVGLFLAFPLSLIYAVVRHRVFDIPNQITINPMNRDL